MQVFSFRNSLCVLLFLLAGTVFSQDLGSETVVVIKPYTPSVHDAQKIREIPKIQDSISMEKKPVQYQIFSVPVASTFTPAKGRAANVQRKRPINIYDNYATLGFGNFTSVLAEFYSNIEVSRSSNFGIFLTHNSAQGDKEKPDFLNQFYDTELNLNYASWNQNSNWNLEAGLEHQLYNWYGVPKSIFPDLNLDNFDPKQNYYSFYAGGELNLDDSFLDKTTAKYRYFGDGFSSQEHRLQLKPSLRIPIGGELFKTNLEVDYLNGSFDRQYISEGNDIAYSFLNLGLSSSVVVLRDDLSLNLGAAVYYSRDNERGKGSIYVYPKVTGSYRMAGEYLVAYGGVEGELNQNSYYDFVQKNPFLSPTLRIRPTDMQYNGYLGIKGKLSGSVGYNFRANYKAEDYKALFRANPIGVSVPDKYSFGNSFQVVYDDIKTLSAFGELSVDVNRNFNLRVNAEFFDYDTHEEKEAWNLPDMKASVLVDYQIGDNWYAGANLFYVGERKDYRSFLPEGFSKSPETLTLDSFTDLNVNLGYRFNEQLSIFVKGNNLLGKNYQRWADYPVLGLQVMGGVTYKFDY